jgi:hypothetical protein
VDGGRAGGRGPGSGVAHAPIVSPGRASLPEVIGAPAPLWSRVHMGRSWRGVTAWCSSHGGRVADGAGDAPLEHPLHVACAAGRFAASIGDPGVVLAPRMTMERAS